MFRKIFLTFALVSSPLFGADTMTERPGTVAPKPQPQPRPAAAVATPILPGSFWIGTEELNQNGRLHIGFRRNGVAVMTDAHATIEGTWTKQRNEIVVAFKNCVYRGSIRGNDLVGRGTVTEGEKAGQSWAFRITHVNPFAGLTFTGSENLNGFGGLTLTFGADGTVAMKDARSESRGTYTYDVGDITIRFRNCEYTGTIQPGNVFAGTARYTQGNTGGPWTFSVRLK